MVKLAHIVNPLLVRDPNSDLRYAQPVSIRSMLAARDRAKAAGVSVTGGGTTQVFLIIGSFRPDLSQATLVSSSSLSFTIGFPAINGANNYEAQWDTDAGFSAPTSATSASPSLDVTLGGNLKYYVRVRATNTGESRTGSWADPFNVTGPIVADFTAVGALLLDAYVTSLIAGTVAPRRRDSIALGFLALGCGWVTAASGELLRYDPPTHYTVRTSTTDIEVAGGVIPKGKKVAMMIGSACRDPEEFEEPTKLDIHRNVNRQLALGFGRHLCLGSALVRMEGKIALEEWHKRFPKYEVLAEKIEWVHSSNVRGFSSLPVRIIK